MAPQGAVRVEGVDATQSGLRRMERRISDTDAPADRAGNLVADEARARAPRRSGALADSIDVSVSAGVATVTAGGPDVPYAGVQEYSWPARNIPAQPYLRPAAEDRTPDVADAYREHVRGNVRRFDAEVR